MSERWVKIFSSEVSYMGELIQGILQTENIPSFIINKKDSMYTLLDGEIEVYVLPDDVIRAKHLIDKNASD